MVVTRGIAEALAAKQGRERSAQRAREAIANAVSQAARDVAQAKAQRSLLDEQKEREDAEKQYQRKVEEEQRAWERQYKEREYADKQRDAARKRTTELLTGLAGQGISPEDIIAKAVGPPPERKTGLFGITDSARYRTEADAHKQRLIETMERIGISGREKQLYDAMANAAKRTRAQSEEDRRRKAFEGKLGNLETLEDIRTSRAKRLAPPDQPELPSSTREYLAMADGLFPGMADEQRRGIAMTWAKEDRDADLALSRLRSQGIEADIPGTVLNRRKRELERRERIFEKAQDLGDDMVRMVSGARLRYMGKNGPLASLASVMSSVGFINLPRTVKEDISSMLNDEINNMKKGDANKVYERAIDRLAEALFKNGMKDRARLLLETLDLPDPRRGGAPDETGVSDEGAFPGEER